jgi:phenylacetate-CoA ligase
VIDETPVLQLNLRDSFSEEQIRITYDENCSLRDYDIVSVLLNIGGDVTPNYQIIVDRENNTDTFQVNVEMSEALFADGMKGIEKTTKLICEKLRSTLGIGPKVNLVNPKSIERSEGKAKRVIDKRKLK